jgi:hypothetical protein
MNVDFNIINILDHVDDDDDMLIDQHDRHDDR